MRLLVSCIPYDGGKSGISVYVREVVRALLAQGHGLTLLVEPDVDAAAIAGAPVPFVRAPAWTKRAALSMLWHLLFLPFRIRRRRKDFDGFVVCAANRRVCARYPLPTAATVHDLANFHVPGKYSRSRMFYLARVLPFFAKRARRLVAVSEATKADMVRFWRCRPDDVTVLYDGLSVPSSDGRMVSSSDGRMVPSSDGRMVPSSDGRMVPSSDGRMVPSSDGRMVSSSDGRMVPSPDHETMRPYDHSTIRPSDHSAILYISRIEHPGKNHVRLIEAYGRLPRALAEKHPLVLAGADWKDAETVHAAAAASPHADLVRFAGFVPDAGMDALWAQTGFYVFPSLFEGFGLSLAEAMARGIPCACSDNGSLGEIGQGVAATFDPEDPGAIAAALETLLAESPADRAARVARGFERVKRFSWPAHAEGLAKLLAPAAAVPLFRIPVSRVTNAGAFEAILGWARAGKARRAAGGFAGPPKAVATINVDFVVNAVPWRPSRPGGELLDCLKKADMVTADGMPIVALSRLLRDPLPERVAGSDLTPALCRACAAEGLRFYVLGGTPEVLADAFEKLGIAGSPAIAGTDSSRIDLEAPQDGVLARIAAAKPDLLFVALGNPKQELWIRRNLARIDAPVAIGVGGSFNFVSGRVKRAPGWVQRCGLEWVHRIAQEPGRLWRRYALGLVKFSWLSALAICGAFRERNQR